MGRGVRVGLRPEWKPAWLNGLANATGEVFLHCTHCNSESPVETHCCPFSASVHGIEFLFPTPSWLSTRGPRLPGGSARRWGARCRRRSSLEEEEGRNRNIWCCQSLFESQFSHLYNGNNGYFIVTHFFFPYAFPKISLAMMEMRLDKCNK